VSLPCRTRKPLNLPARAFNADGLAVLMLTGGRYGGDWAMGFAPMDAPGDICGELRTEAGDRKGVLLSDPGYPGRAAETAFIWLLAQAREHGWRLVAWECMNSVYSPPEAAYFVAARAIVANESFTPAEGVTYADEQTLDAAMGYVPVPGTGDSESGD
jgi:hypothetical protein